MMIADLSGWQVGGCILGGFFIATLIFLAWVRIEASWHRRKLREMQRATNEKRNSDSWRDAPTERITRPKFLP